MTENPTKAIRTFFGLDGKDGRTYEALKARELLDFKNADPEGYEELGKLANEILAE